jgi:hypothetical protein
MLYFEIASISCRPSAGLHPREDVDAKHIIEQSILPFQNLSVRLPFSFVFLDHGDIKKAQKKLSSGREGKCHATCKLSSSAR